MTLQDIVISSNSNLDLLLTIEGHPVWDYKIGMEQEDVILISEDPWEGVESEYVTLKELLEFTQDSGIPLEDVKLYTESDYEQLINVICKEDTLVLSHY